jgi:predicted short-subunit dehydrogenase-like oxidoreductase (DUF2520 family)
MGLTLASAMIRAGHTCVGVQARTRKGMARARRVLRPLSRSISAFDEREPFDLLLLALPDDRIEQAALRWSRIPGWKGRFAFHLSGVLPSSALQPLRESGAATGSLHPLTSVPHPSTQAKVFEGVTFSLEGDAKACALGSRLVRSFGGSSLRLAQEAKGSYHLAACLSSGYLLVLLAMAAEHLSSQSSLARSRSRSALLGLATVTLHNAVRGGLQPALTGPIPRGDIQTLRRHLSVLRGASPSLRQLHRILASGMTDLVTQHGRLDPKAARTIRLLLSRSPRSLGSPHERRRSARPRRRRA